VVKTRKKNTRVLRKRKKTNLGRSDLKGRWWLHNVPIITTLGFVKIKTWIKIKTRGKN
jgi:hypothetical protein